MASTTPETSENPKALRTPQHPADRWQPCACVSRRELRGAQGIVWFCKVQLGAELHGEQRARRAEEIKALRERYGLAGS